jgi:histidinol dehydrogenase
MRIETWDDLDDEARSAALSRPATRDDESIRATAAEIIRSVRSGGDAAVRAMTSKFDGTELDHLKVSEEELAAAARELKVADSLPLGAVTESHREVWRSFWAWENAFFRLSRELSSHS